MIISSCSGLCKLFSFQNHETVYSTVLLYIKKGLIKIEDQCILIPALSSVFEQNVEIFVVFSLRYLIVLFLQVQKQHPKNVHSIILYNNNFTFVCE